MGWIIRHREFIKDIEATSAFTLQSFDINPGLSTTFPWLSNVADAYEEYQMRGLVFEVKSLSSDAVLSASTSSALGSVMMATSYNSLNPDFINKQQMLNYEFANSSKPSVSFYHPVECKKNWTPVSELYVRTGSVPAGADQRLYDLGKFQLATEGMQASSGICGELWATYEIELYKPRFDLGVEEEILADHWYLSGVTSTATLGVTSAKSASSNLGGTTNANDTYLFPVTVPVGSKFLVVIYWNGTTPTAALVAVANLNNCTGINLWLGDSVYNTESSQAATAGTFTLTMTIEITSVNASFQIVGASSAIPGGTVTGDMFITQLPVTLVD